MTNYRRFDKDYLTTSELQDNLKNCIGRSTVEIFRCEYDNRPAFAVYHYQALIAVYVPILDLFIANYRFYDYSGSTSRVRNEFFRLFSFYQTAPTTAQFRKVENTGEVFTSHTINCCVLKLENERVY